MNSARSFILVHQSADDPWLWADEEDALIALGIDDDNVTVTGPHRARDYFDFRFSSTEADVLSKALTDLGKWDGHEPAANLASTISEWASDDLKASGEQPRAAFAVEPTSFSDTLTWSIGFERAATGAALADRLSAHHVSYWYAGEGAGMSADLATVHMLLQARWCARGTGLHDLRSRMWEWLTLWDNDRVSDPRL